MKRCKLLILIASFVFLGLMQTIQAEVKVGYGWSTNDDIKAAVNEAVSSLRAQLGKTKPDYVILFSTVGYDSNELVKEVRFALGDKVKLYGGTSCLGVLTKEGFHIGKKASMAILAIASDEIIFGVGGADLNKLTPQEAGRKAISLAIENAGKASDQKPRLVLITAAPGKEEEILRGITEVIGEDVPIIGGSAADNTIEGLWKQFANEKVYDNGVVLTAIYTELPIGIAYQSGYYRTINKGTITKAQGRVIYEIDGKPAAEVYNEWLEGKLSDVLETGGNILARTTYYPLAKVLRGREGQIYYLSIHPLSFELPAKSLTVFANVKSGDKIQLMRGSWELLLNRARTTTLQALRNAGIKKKDVAFAIFTYCAGTMLAIPEDQRPNIPALINSVLEGAPFIGTFTFGEQGYLSGVGNVHGNLVNSMIIFGKEK